MRRDVTHPTPVNVGWQKSNPHPLFIPETLALGGVKLPRGNARSLGGVGVPFASGVPPPDRPTREHIYLPSEEAPR